MSEPEQTLGMEIERTRSGKDGRRKMAKCPAALQVAALADLPLLVELHPIGELVPVSRSAGE